MKDTIVALGYTEDYDIEPLYNTDIYKNALSEVIKKNPDNAVYQQLQEHFNEYE